MKVLKADASAADAFAEIDLGSDQPTVWVTFTIRFDPAAYALWPSTFSGYFLETQSAGHADFTDYIGIGTSTAFGWLGGWMFDSAGAPHPDLWQIVEVRHTAGGAAEYYVGGLLVGSGVDTFGTDTRFVDLGLQAAPVDPASIVYIDNVKVGTTRGGSDLFADDFESGNLSAWTTTSGAVSVIDYPPVPTPPAGRRVGIAWDDGPLEPNPTWTFLDDGVTFPPQFVAGYDISNGRQTLISQTETGTATVYINDRTGLLDDRNDLSPYQGKLSGRQILLQLYNPVTEVWEPQFQGLIDDYRYDIDGSAVDANGDPINASIQIECVDIFDYLEGFGLTPGYAGVRPTPAGMEDGVYYAQTTGSVQDRIIEILTDVGIDSTRYIVASGNVNVIAVKYDPDESALTALRDAADAELPFIANMYVNRFGQFAFRGRYSRFDPDEVAAEPGSDWDFERWYVGDGKAIQADPTRAQIRILGYSRDRGDLINAAIAYVQGATPDEVLNGVYANTPSITAYGHHQAAPMSDLLTCEPTVSGYNKNVETMKYAELLVKNKKDPRISPTALQLKSLRPDDYRAEATWAVICGADISHIINIDVGYPGGTGLVGDSPDDDFYIEGRSLVLRPMQPTFDYVECNLELSPAVWSMDTHGVFPAFS